MGSRHSPDCDETRLLQGLRDFFMARDEQDLERACATVPGFQTRDVDWERTLFGFNRLFVGPMALQAPPFASVWLDPEPYLMGQSTLDARHVYQMLGLQARDQGSLPDDHVSLELDALAAMQAALQARDSPDLRRLRAHFLEHHVLRWMPQFCGRIIELEDTPAAVADMARLLLRWLEDTRESLVRNGGARAPLCTQSDNTATPEVRS